MNKETTELEKSKKRYIPIALLPFIDLSKYGRVLAGPVLYLSGKSYLNLISAEERPKNSEYMKWFGTFKTFINKDNHQCVTEMIEPNEMTIIALEKDFFELNKAKIGAILTDAINVLYFSAYFHSFINNSSIEFINPFRFIIGFEEDYVKQGPPWSNQWNFEVNRERSIRIYSYDEKIIRAFGKLVDNKYGLSNDVFSERVLRSVEYYVGRFKNIEKGPISSAGGTPEDFVFLTVSFEALFDINNPKQKWLELFEKIVGVMKIEETPKEYLKKWTEGFYNLRNDIAHGRRPRSEIFNDNPNLEMHYASLGYRLLPICIHKVLSNKKYIKSNKFDYLLFSKDSIILNLLWPQLELLKKIMTILKSMSEATKTSVFYPLLIQLEKYERMYLDIYGQPKKHQNYKVQVLFDKRIKHVVDVIQFLCEQVKRIDEDEMKLKLYWAGKSAKSTKTEILLMHLNNLIIGSKNEN